MNWNIDSVSSFVNDPSKRFRIFSNSSIPNYPLLLASYATNVRYNDIFFIVKMLYNFMKHFFTFTYNSEFNNFFLKSSSYSFDPPLLNNKLSNSFWQWVVRLMWFFYISCSNSLSDTLPSEFLSNFSKKYTSSSLFISGLIFFSNFENYLKVKSWLAS